MESRKSIAAIVTTYFPGSHANLIVSKFARGFPTQNGIIQPDVKLTSLYIDQFHPMDIGMQFAQDNGVSLFPSIRSALTLVPADPLGDWPTSSRWNDGKLAVDGVIIIGEHGDYPLNHLDQRIYPRRHFFESVCAVFSLSDKSVPVFLDKHLSYNWDDAQQIYNKAINLDIPLMAGSSLPVSKRDPELEHNVDSSIDEALSLGYIHSYQGGLESYGFHNLEALQCMVERRTGGEKGIAAVQCLEGQSVWEAGDKGIWSKTLLKAAEQKIKDKMSGEMKNNCPNPTVFLLEYRDGFRAACMILPYHIRGWGYAASVEGQIQSTSFASGSSSDLNFSYQALNIQKMFTSGKPQYPSERTLLTTGALEALMKSRHQGNIRIETPHLAVSYQPFKYPPLRA